MRPIRRMSIAWHDLLHSIEATDRRAAGRRLYRQPAISTALYLAHHLRKPILVEGPAGVGKTELAKAVASWLGLPLIRMQCYEGLDESKALYEWKYGKQLLYTQILRTGSARSSATHPDLDAALDRLHGFRRPVLLRALPRAPPAAARAAGARRRGAADRRGRQGRPGIRGLPAGDPVRLPGQHPRDRHHRGRRRRRSCILTSNSMRDLGDALKRRCLHLHIGLPDARAGGADHRHPRARHRGGRSPAARRLRAAAARARPEEAAVGQRDHRLGARAGAAACERSWTAPWCGTR